MSVRPISTIPNSWIGIQQTYQLPAYQHPNPADFCLAEEAEYWEMEIGRKGLANICCPKGRKPYSQPPWIMMPAEGRRFKPIGVLPLPDLSNPANVGVLIPIPFNTTTGPLVVPIGYDGAIADVQCYLSAPPGQSTGFLEGSGDVIFRLSCNSRYIRDFGNVKTSLGNLVLPNPTPRGRNRILSGNNVEWFVEFGPNADMNLNPSCNVIVSLTGWVYPR